MGTTWAVAKNAGLALLVMVAFFLWGIWTITLVGAAMSPQDTCTTYYFSSGPYTTCTR